MAVLLGHRYFNIVDSILEVRAPVVDVSPSWMAIRRRGCFFVLDSSKGMVP